MRILAVTYLFFSGILIGFSAPEKLEIPKSNWEPIFFQSIDSLTKRAGWSPLRQTDLPKGTLEVRVWVGFGLQPLQGFRLRRDGDRWSGWHARDRFGDNWPLEVRDVKPQIGWDAFWRKIESLGILILPDSSTLPDEAMVLDGVSYVVEISDGQIYRTYQYGNPQEQKWDEAKKIIEIAKVIYGELLPRKK